MNVKLCLSDSNNGWMNLATDEYLLNTVGDDDVILYFYINSDSVIIGKNQNAWKECNISAMDADSVRLVRRITGGGAVFHDVGNLNFSFIMGERHYDLDRQLGCILDAVRSVGIDAGFSGRNDILVEGRKFSGNAFGARRGKKQHHGTLLVNADLSRLPNYLNVSEKKIKSKGIDSVRSRVCNLKEYNEDLTVEKMLNAVIAAFEREYGNYELMTFDDDAKKEIYALYEKHSSWEWRLGKTPKFEIELGDRLPWGETQVFFTLSDGIIIEVKVYTDALNTEIPVIVEKALLGVRFDADEICDKLKMTSKLDEIKELADLLKKQIAAL